MREAIKVRKVTKARGDEHHGEVNFISLFVAY